MVLQDLGRILTAMVTPFNKNHQVDHKRAAELAARLVERGSDGLVVAGTTGESATLTTEEKLKLFETVVDAVGDRATVIAGCGSNATEASIALTRQAVSTGVHGILLVVPYYNKPPQEGLYQHFAAVAGATKLPVVLYNVPSRTGANLLPATVLRLAREVPNIVAVKEASGSLDQAAQILAGKPKEFHLYSGDDDLTLPLLALGASGVVSVAAHLVGPDMQRMIEAYLAGNVKLAAEIHLRLHPLFKGLFITTNPIPVKWALRYVGFDVGGVRLPLCEPSPEEQKAIKDLLYSLELI